MKESRLTYFGYWQPGWEKVKVDWVRMMEEGNITECVTHTTKKEMLSPEGEWPRRSAKAILVNHRGRALVGKRASEDSSEGGKWEFAGGKVDEGEDSRQTIVREINEELGTLVRVEYWKDMVNVHNETTWKMDLFVGQLSEEQTEQILLNGEFEEIAFVGPEDLDRYEWAFGLYGDILASFFSASNWSSGD